MNWEQKCEMIKYSNSGDNDNFCKIVVDNIDTIDEQGWDMFFTAIELTAQNIEKNLEQYKIINAATKELKTKSIRTAMRMVMYNQLVEDLISNEKNIKNAE